MAEATLDDRLQALVGRPISDGGPTHGPGSGEPADDPALGRRVRGREPRVHRSRRGGAVALRRDRRAAADAADLDDGDAADHRHGRARRLAGRRRRAPRCSTCSTRRASSARSRRTPSSRSCATSDSATSCRRRRCSSRCRREKQTRIGPGHFVTWVDDLHRRGRRGRRPPDVPHPEVPTRTEHRRELPARAVDDGRHAVLLGRRAASTGC